MRKGGLRLVIMELVRWIREKKVVVEGKDRAMIERAVAAGMGKKKGKEKEEVK